ncbi:MAG: SAM-dependent methyltransferase, partial [Stackebrandtia sp.]
MNDDSGEVKADGVDPVDTNRASVARAYDFVLGGKDNYEADRKFAERILQHDPEVRLTAHLNKEFGRRVVDHLARQGIRQFLDLGSGIPTSPPSVHDTARRVRDEARVVYVDHDPVVAAHNRALRVIGPGLAVIQDSFLNIDGILGQEDFKSNIDLAEPVGVLFFSVLQAVPTD